MEMNAYNYFIITGLEKRVLNVLKNDINYVIFICLVSETILMAF